MDELEAEERTNYTPVEQAEPPERPVPAGGTTSALRSPAGIGILVIAAASAVLVVVGWLGWIWGPVLIGGAFIVVGVIYYGMKARRQGRTQAEGGGFFGLLFRRRRRDQPAVDASGARSALPAARKITGQGKTPAPALVGERGNGAAPKGRLGAFASRVRRPGSKTGKSDPVASGGGARRGGSRLGLFRRKAANGSREARSAAQSSGPDSAAGRRGGSRFALPTWVRRAGKHSPGPTAPGQGTTGKASGSRRSVAQWWRKAKADAAARSTGRKATKTSNRASAPAPARTNERNDTVAASSAPKGPKKAGGGGPAFAPWRNPARGKTTAAKPSDPPKANGQTRAPAAPTRRPAKPAATGGGGQPAAQGPNPAASEDDGAVAWVQKLRGIEQGPAEMAHLYRRLADQAEGQPIRPGTSARFHEAAKLMKDAADILAEAHEGAVRDVQPYRDRAEQPSRGSLHIEKKGDVDRTHRDGAI